MFSFLVSCLLMKIYLILLLAFVLLSQDNRNVINFYINLKMWVGRDHIFWKLLFLPTIPILFGDFNIKFYSTSFLYILLPIPLWNLFRSELIILISAYNWYWIVGGVRKEQIEFFYKLSFYKIQLNKIKPSTMNSSLSLIYILSLLSCTMQFVIYANDSLDDYPLPFF